MKVLYVHGFGGSADGESSKLVKECLGKVFAHFEFLAPQIPYLDPKKATKLISDLSEDCDLVVASSLGAFYTASCSPGAYKILINPALPDNVKKIFPEMSDGYYNDLCAIKDRMEFVIDNDFRYETYLIFGTKDDVCSNEGYYSGLYWNSHISKCDIGQKFCVDRADALIDVVKKIFC